MRRGWRKDKGVASGSPGAAASKKTVKFEEPDEVAQLRAALAASEAKAAEAAATAAKERQGRLASEAKAAEAEAKAAEAEAKAAEERQGRLVAETALEEQNKPIGDCIQNTSFTTKAFAPKWGDPLLPGESKRSTITSSAWLQVDPDDVETWLDGNLIQFLQEADEIEVERDGEYVPLLQILKEGKADTLLQSYLSGDLAAGAASSQRTKNEVVVEDMLVKYLWTPLTLIMQGDVGVENSDRFPIKKYAQLMITPGGGNTSGAFVPVPPQYAGFYKLDRAIEFKYHPSGLLSHPRLRLPNVLQSDAEEAVDQQVVSRHARIVVEVKPDSVCPKPKVRDDEAKNQAYSGSLVDYVKSPHFDPLYNPVAQVVTYGCATRTNCVMIHTLNQMTLGRISDDPSRLHVVLSRKFDSTVALPFASSGHPSAASWSLWEVLVRFILASTKHWYVKHFPDALKEKFKQRQDARRSESKKRSQPGQDKPNEQEEEEERPSAGAGMTHAHALASFSYADLWAPLRFAIPATHSIEEESTLDRLDGDAELIGCGRIGPVYRQTLHGRDVAVKLLILTVQREIDGLWMYPYSLREELANEVEVYNHLRSLQGKTIPVLLWHGTLVEGMADALATEYCGTELPNPLSEEQKWSAMHALESLHEHGVLHGDVASRNFVCKDKEIRLLDFGFSKFRENVTEAEWLEGVNDEKMLLRKELGIHEEARKRPRDLR